MNLKLPNGQFFIPSETITDPTVQGNLGYNAILFGPKTTFTADQVNGNIDYSFSSKDRLAGKYYFQRDPTFAPFAISQVGNFPQQLSAGSHAFSLENTRIISSNAVWTQHFGFIREKAFAHTEDGYTNSDYGTNIFGFSQVPGISITTANPNTSKPLSIGPASNFADAGIFQNTFEGATTVSWTQGRNTWEFGVQVDHAQLNIENKNNETAAVGFDNFFDFAQGNLCTPANGCFAANTTFLNGSTNRYYRSNQVGTFAQDTSGSGRT